MYLTHDEEVVLERYARIHPQTNYTDEVIFKSIIAKALLMLFKGERVELQKDKCDKAIRERK